MNKEQIRKYLECCVVEFVECGECRAKPGSPTLCESCLKNRAAIATCKEMIDEFIQTYQAAIDNSVIVGTGDTETDGRFVDPVAFTQAMGVLPAPWMTREAIAKGKQNEINNLISKLLNEFANTPLDERGNGWDWLIRLRNQLPPLDWRER